MWSDVATTEWCCAPSRCAPDWLSCSVRYVAQASFWPSFCSTFRCAVEVDPCQPNFGPPSTPEFAICADCGQNPARFRPHHGRLGPHSADCMPKSTTSTELGANSVDSGQTVAKVRSDSREPKLVALGPTWPRVGMGDLCPAPSLGSNVVQSLERARSGALPRKVPKLGARVVRNSLCVGRSVRGFGDAWCRRCRCSQGRWPRLGANVGRTWLGAPENHSKLARGSSFRAS